MDIRAMLGLPSLLDIGKILCVQPHPDDNEVGAAGTLMELAQRGCEILYATVTDGRAGAFGLEANPESLVERRRLEQAKAGAIIGVCAATDLGYPDGGQYAVDDVARDVVQLIRKHRPDMVMTVDPWMPYEAHPDHVRTGTAVMRAVLFSDNSIVHPVEEGRLPFAVPQVALYATSHPNTYVDVTAHWERKMASLQAHESQFGNDEWVLLSAYFAESAREVYQSFAQDASRERVAEAFKVLATRQLHFFPQAIYS